MKRMPVKTTIRLIEHKISRFEDMIKENKDNPRNDPSEIIPEPYNTVMNKIQHEARIETSEMAIKQLEWVLEKLTVG